MQQLELFKSHIPKFKSHSYFFPNDNFIETLNVNINGELFSCDIWGGDNRITFSYGGFEEHSINFKALKLLLNHPHKVRDTAFSSHIMYKLAILYMVKLEKGEITPVEIVE